MKRRVEIHWIAWVVLKDAKAIHVVKNCPMIRPGARAVRWRPRQHGLRVCRTCRRLLDSVASVEAAAVNMAYRIIIEPPGIARGA